MQIQSASLPASAYTEAVVEDGQVVDATPASMLGDAPADPSDPGSAPIGDGVDSLTLMIACFGVYRLYKSKKKK